jgi:hypothetical protein
MVIEDPPGFIVRTEAQKAASANGFRLPRAVEHGWLGFASTTAQVMVWVGREAMGGQWLLSIDRPEVIAEVGSSPAPDTVGPGAVSFVFGTLSALYAALDRVYRLGVSLPDAPLHTFQAAARDLPRTTEAERLVIQRVGQDLFRKALLAYWGGRCPLTGITDEALLRASHIVPWVECETDKHRLDVHNGLLLSALWDAAFDAGLVSFADDGAVLPAPLLAPTSAEALGLRHGIRLLGLTVLHRSNLTWHRLHHGFSSEPSASV